MGQLKEDQDAAISVRIEFGNKLVQIESPRRERAARGRSSLRDPSCVIEAHSSSVVNLGWFHKRTFAVTGEIQSNV
jgi:hypothetical protein